MPRRAAWNTIRIKQKNICNTDFGNRRSVADVFCFMESLSPWELLGQQPCPLRRLRASSPRGRALGKPVKFPLDEQSLFVSWTVVPCCLGQRQLDKVRCPEAAALCSKARPFTSYRAFSGQAKVARPAKGSPFGGAGERSETEREGLQKKLFMNAISLAARAGTASSRRTGRTGWGRARSISKPPL